MKILNGLKTDAKVIMRNLQDTNETLLNTLIDYQDIIFEQRETIDWQIQEIERLQHYEQSYKDLKAEHLETVKVIKQVEYDAVKEFAERIKNIYAVHGGLHSVIDNLVKEMVGDSDA